MQVHLGILSIGNTSARKSELRDAVTRYMTDDCLTPENAESLRSCLMFGESQIFGRSAPLALKAVGSPAVQGKACRPVSDEVRFGLEWMMRRLVEAPPREIRARDSESLLLFIDGACEPFGGDGGALVTSIGGVLLDGTGRGLRFFGMQMPDDIYCSAWSGGVKRNLVFEGEVLPYNLALLCWSDLLKETSACLFSLTMTGRDTVGSRARPIHSMRIR